MKFAVVLLIALSLAGGTGPARPDPKLTPGLASTDDVKQICSTKWGKDERHVTPKMKAEVCEAYHAKRCPGPGWEINHLISRELGGADDIRNLWPQPAPSFHQKDVLENLLHRKVCAGEISLAHAQACLVSDWWACYQKYANAK